MQLTAHFIESTGEGCSGVMRCVWCAEMSAPKGVFVLLCRYRPDVACNIERGEGRNRPLVLGVKYW